MIPEVHRLESLDKHILGLPLTPRAPETPVANERVRSHRFAPAESIPRVSFPSVQLKDYYNAGVAAGGADGGADGGEVRARVRVVGYYFQRDLHYLRPL